MKRRAFSPFYAAAIAVSATLGIALVLGSCATFVGKDPASDSRAVFEQLWSDVNQRYALLDVKGIDWRAVHEKYSPMVTPDVEEHALFRLMSEMLSVLNDKHMRLESSFASFNAGAWGSTEGYFSLDLVERVYVQDAKRSPSGQFTYGHLAPSVGYVFLRSFSNNKITLTTNQSWTRELDGILAELSDTDALVFDDRNNLGGLPGNVDAVASRFADKERPYAYVRNKSGPRRDDFSSPVTFTVAPAGTTSYTKPVVLVTNGVTISGGEWFTLAMKSLPNVTHVGATTAGAFSLSLERPLSNGWNYTVSVQKVTDTGGTCFEGIGISPDTDNRVMNTAGDLAGGHDPQLERALTVALSAANGA